MEKPKLTDNDKFVEYPAKSNRVELKTKTILLKTFEKVWKNESRLYL